MPSDTPPLAERPLFFLDYDGTLAPIVEDPAQARPHPEVPGVLEKLSAIHPLWIVTGRHLRDLVALMPLPLQAIGLHGTQQAVIGEDIAHVATVSPEDVARLRQALPDLEGLVVEDKESTFAVHYRSASDPDTVRQYLQAWLRDLPEHLEAIWGKMVVEIRLRGHHKGTAVARIAADYPDHTPIYLGDDVTDEDAFRALGDDAITIKVGPGDTTAHYRLPDVNAAVAYLRAYLGVG